MIAQFFSKLADTIHSQNVAVGWWNDIDREKLLSKSNLITSEVMEMYEGIRKDQMDEHLPGVTAEEAELADVTIRALDLLGYLHNTSALPVQGDPGVHTSVADLVDGANEITNSLRGNNNPYASVLPVIRLLMKLDDYAQKRHIDLHGIVERKHAYNAQRADHKLENRAKTGGKKF